MESHSELALHLQLKDQAPPIFRGEDGPPAATPEQIRLWDEAYNVFKKRRPWNLLGLLLILGTVTVIVYRIVSEPGWSTKDLSRYTVFSIYALSLFAISAFYFDPGYKNDESGNESFIFRYRYSVLVAFKRIGEFFREGTASQEAFGEMIKALISMAILIFVLPLFSAWALIAAYAWFEPVEKIHRRVHESGRDGLSYMKGTNRIVEMPPAGSAPPAEAKIAPSGLGVYLDGRVSLNDDGSFSIANGPRFKKGIFEDLEVMGVKITKKVSDEDANVRFEADGVILVACFAEGRWRVLSLGTARD